MEKRLTQKGIADRLGVTAGFISMVESGKKMLSDDHMQELIDYLGASLDELIYDVREREHQVAFVAKLFAGVPEDVRKRAVDILYAFVSSNSGDQKRLYESFTREYAAGLSLGEIIRCREGQKK